MMTQEEALYTEAILLGLRARHDPTALVALQNLLATPGFDPAIFQERALHEGVAPLLYVTLRGRGVLPSTLETSLRRSYLALAGRNLLVFRELSRVLRGLSDAGIEVVILKGGALAEAVYGNIAVRPMCDIDLLIRRSAVPAALEVLRAEGYEANEREARAGDTLTYENEIMLRRAGGAPQMLLEVHWSLLDSPHHQQVIPMDWFWQTTRPIEIEGVPAKALGVEAQILHLCGHLLLHHGSGEVLRLLWLHDIAEVIHSAAEVDWELLAAQAGACDLVLPVQDVMEELVDRWHLPVPDHAVAQLRALEPSADEARVFAWLTAPQRPVAQRFAADLAALSDWRTRVRYAYHSLFPSPSYIMKRYGLPRWLVPIGYPYRWVLGLWSWLARRRR
ncbi:MAG: nucleotidyltransferase family protein [Anaerolineae bacterium]